MKLSKKRALLKNHKLLCGMCGASSSDPDPYSPGRRICLHHLDHANPADRIVHGDFRTLCSNCFEGRRNLLHPSKPNPLSIIPKIDSLPLDQQRWIFEKLQSHLEVMD